MKTNFVLERIDLKLICVICILALLVCAIEIIFPGSYVVNNDNKNYTTIDNTYNDYKTINAVNNQLINGTRDRTDDNVCCSRYPNGKGLYVCYTIQNINDCEGIKDWSILTPTS